MFTGSAHGSLRACRRSQRHQQRLYPRLLSAFTKGQGTPSSDASCNSAEGGIREDDLNEKNH